MVPALCTMRTAKSWAMLEEASVDPSSTTMHSKGETLEDARASKQSPSEVAPLKTGMITEIVISLVSHYILGRSLRRGASVRIRPAPRVAGDSVRHIVATRLNAQESLTS
jgi:hypothetical protein